MGPNNSFWVPMGTKVPKCGPMLEQCFYHGQKSPERLQHSGDPQVLLWGCWQLSVPLFFSPALNRLIASINNCYNWSKLFSSRKKTNSSTVKSLFTSCCSFLATCLPWCSFTRLDSILSSHSTSNPFIVFCRQKHFIDLESEIGALDVIVVHWAQLPQQTSRLWNLDIGEVAQLTQSYSY